MAASRRPDDFPGTLDAFPADFLYGKATAACQIERGAAEGRPCPSVWDTFSDAPVRIPKASACWCRDMIEVFKLEKAT